MNNTHKPHQRKNAVSNTQVGIDFENLAYEFFKNQFPSLKKPFWLPIGHIKKKEHKFDLGFLSDQINLMK